MAKLQHNGLVLWLQDRLHEERVLLERQHMQLLRDFAAQQQTFDSLCAACVPQADEGCGDLMEQQRQNHHIEIREEVSEREDIGAIAERSSVTTKPSSVPTKPSAVTTKPSSVPTKPSASTTKRSSSTTRRSLVKSPSEFVKSWAASHTDTTIGQLVASRWFEVVFAVIILLNVVVMILESQYMGLSVGHEVDFPKYAEVGKNNWQNASHVFDVVNIIFGILYTIEVVLRIIGKKCAFFKVGNMVDLLVVLLFYLETIASVNFPFDTMLLRFFRLAKVLRWVRLVHQIAGLEHMLMMVVAVKGSLTMLLWTSVLLFFILSLFAFILNRLFVEYAVQSEDLSMDVRRKCFEYFGTFSRSLFSMFELTLANLTPISRFLMEDLSEFFIIFTVAYKVTLGFAVVGVLNACFIKQTFKIVGSNKHIRVIEKKSEKNHFKKEMKTFIKHTDTSRDGKIAKAEFIRVFQDANAEAWMESHGLDASDAKKLFTLIDAAGDGIVEGEELVKEVAALKGPATGLNLAISRNEQLAFEAEVYHRLEIINQSLLEIRMSRQTSEKAHDTSQELGHVSAI